MASLWEALIGNQPQPSPEQPAPGSYLQPNRLSELLMSQSLMPAQNIGDQSGVLSRLPGAPRETPADVWNNPTPGGLFDIIKSFGTLATMPGRTLDGAYNGVDEFGRTGQQRMYDDASHAAGAVTMGSMPGAFLRAGLGMGGGRGSPQISKLSGVDELRSAILDYINDRGFVGLRTTERPIASDRIKPSFEWIDGRRTRNRLDGVSTTGISNESEIERAFRAHGVLPVDWSNSGPGFYHGKYLSLLSGSDHKPGFDRYERILSDPVLLGQWIKPENPF